MRVGARGSSYLEWNPELLQRRLEEQYGDPSPTQVRLAEMSRQKALDREDRQWRAQAQLDQRRREHEGKIAQDQRDAQDKEDQRRLQEERTGALVQDYMDQAGMDTHEETFEDPEAVEMSKGMPGAVTTWQDDGTVSPNQAGGPGGGPSPAARQGVGGPKTQGHVSKVQLNVMGKRGEQLVARATSTAQKYGMQVGPPPGFVDQATANKVREQEERGQREAAKAKQEEEKRQGIERGWQAVEKAAELYGPEAQALVHIRRQSKPENPDGAFDDVLTLRAERIKHDEKSFVEFDKEFKAATKAAGAAAEAEWKALQKLSTTEMNAEVDGVRQENPLYAAANRAYEHAKVKAMEAKERVHALSLVSDQFQELYGESPWKQAPRGMERSSEGDSAWNPGDKVRGLVERLKPGQWTSFADGSAVKTDRQGRVVQREPARGEADPHADAVVTGMEETGATADDIRAAQEEEDAAVGGEGNDDFSGGAGVKDAGFIEKNGDQIFGSYGSDRLSGDVVEDDIDAGFRGRERGYLAQAHERMNRAQGKQQEWEAGRDQVQAREGVEGRQAYKDRLVEAGRMRGQSGGERDVAIRGARARGILKMIEDLTVRANRAFDERRPDLKREYDRQIAELRAHLEKELGHG